MSILWAVMNTSLLVGTLLAMVLYVAIVTERQGNWVDYLGLVVVVMLTTPVVAYIVNEIVSVWSAVN